MQKYIFSKVPMFIQTVHFLSKISLAACEFDGCKM